MTATQRDTLERIKSVVELHAKQLAEAFPDGMDGKPVTASKWVFVEELSRVHHLRRSSIRALVKQGFLEERPSGGWGPEVRVKETES